MSAIFWRYNQNKILKSKVLSNLTKSKGKLTDLTAVNYDDKNHVLKRYLLGNSWSVNALRLKSDMDLKVLWYQLLKEKIRLKSDEYKLVQNGDQMNSPIVGKYVENIENSMNSIKELSIVRLKQKNNIMTFLEFFDYKKNQYKEIFDSKYKDYRHIESPMYSVKELEEIGYLSSHLDLFKFVNNSHNLSLAQDRDEIYQFIGRKFNIYDPMGLFRCFDCSKNPEIRKKFNEINILQRIFLILVNCEKNFKKFNIDDKMIEFINSAEKVVLTLDGQIFKTSELKGFTIQYDKENISNQINLYKDFILSIKATLNLTPSGKIKECKQILHSKIIDYIDLVKQEVLKEFESFKKNRLIDFSESLKKVKDGLSLEESIEIEKELVKIKKNSPENLKFISSSASNDRPESVIINKNINPEEYLKDAMDKNLEYVLKQITNEEYILELFKEDFNIKNDSTSIKSRILSQEVINAIINDLPMIDSIKKMKVTTSSMFSLKSNHHKAQVSKILKYKSNLISLREVLFVKENLLIRRNFIQTLDKYIKNHGKFRLKQKRQLYHSIQLGRSKLAKQIVLKELASIAYKAKKISEDINSLNYNNKEEFILGMTEIKAKLKNKKDGTNADIIQKRIDNKNPTKSDESRLFEVVESSLLNTKLKKASEDKFNSIKLFIKNKKDMLRQLEKKKKTNESV